MASTFAEFFGGVTIAALPNQSDVRDGVTYGDGREGTLIVTGGSGGGAGLSGNQGLALDRLFAMTTDDNQFTSSALVNVPTVNGGFTAEDRTKLGLIKAKTDTIGTGTVTSSSPVAPSGTINGPLIIGDDYLAANGRALEWLIDPVAGIDLANVVCSFGLDDCDGQAVTVVGTATLSGDKWKLSFDLRRGDTADFTPAEFDWSVEVKDGVDGAEVTRVRNAGEWYRVGLAAKQT